MADQDQDPPRAPTPTIDEKTIVLSDSHDITICVLSVKNEDGQRSLTKFKVEKEKLKKHSEYFAASFRFNETQGTREVVLKDDDIGAVWVWLLYLHAENEEDLVYQQDNDEDGEEEEAVLEDEASERNEDAERQSDLFESDGVRDTDITRIWHIINAGDKYLLPAYILKPFFEKWYAKNVNPISMDSDLARQIALPCYVFDYALGFTAVTKWLAYEFVGHITEKRPQGFKWKHMHLSPPDFVGPMNHARGSLKTCLHRGIWNPIGSLLEEGDKDCSCGQWASTAGYYFAALVKTKAYPLETTFPKNSINTILERLQKFEASSKIRKIGGAYCSRCSDNWDWGVKKAIEITEDYFDGLCIDCMDRSRPKRGNTDIDYWRQAESVNGRWDHKCRVRHGEPTWYVSWCGRAEHRQKLINTHRENNPRYGKRPQ